MIKTEKHLLGVAYSAKPFTDEELSKIRGRFFRRSIDDFTTTFTGSNGLGYTLTVFDIYRVKDLHFPQRVRHYVRKFITTILGYIGIYPIIRIVV